MDIAISTRMTNSDIPGKEKESNWLPAPAACTPGKSRRRSINVRSGTCGRVPVGRTHVEKPDTEKSSSAVRRCSG